MRKTRFTAITATAAAVLVIGLTQPSAGAVTHQASPAFNTASQPAPSVTVLPNHRGYITTMTTTGGQAQVYSLRGPAQISLTTQTANLASATDGATQLHQANVTINPVNPVAAANKLQSLATPIVNVSEADMVAALGADPATVSQFAKMDNAVSSAPVTPTASVTPTVSAVSTDTPVSLSQLYDRDCYGNSSFDGTKASVYACWNQFLVYQNGGDWYFLDDFYSSGTMHDTGCYWWCDNFTGLYQAEAYVGGNQTYDWNPRDTVSGGSCLTKTINLGYNGVGVSTSYTQCPERSGLYSISALSMATKWDGGGDGPSNGARSTAGTLSMHNPPGVSPTRYYNIKWWWTT